MPWRARAAALAPPHLFASFCRSPFAGDFTLEGHFKRVVVPYSGTAYLEDAAKNIARLLSEGGDFFMIPERDDLDLQVLARAGLDCVARKPCRRRNGVFRIGPAAGFMQLRKASQTRKRSTDELHSHAQKGSCLHVLTEPAESRTHRNAPAFDSLTSLRSTH